MSQAAQLFSRIPGYPVLQRLPRPAQLGLAAAVIALFVVAVMWTRTPAYTVLFSNIDDRDGGSIVSALTQQNIPYRFSENGSAILVPKESVHEVRMQLAAQGLPRGGNVGFELIDQARFGASQFSEQITFQRALEGELANSIRAVHAIQEARVHLALPRESLFVRDRQAPTASVLVSLHPGRSLSEAQVSAISWLVSSSVPNLNAENVSVVDQDGKLLTMPSGDSGSDSLQRNFVNDIEHRSVQRILTLLNPILGSGNVRAQVTAEVDFSRREHTSETYKPNQLPGEATIRSEQTSTSINNNINPAQGVPGALTNQPPINAVAPIVTPNTNAQNQDTTTPTATENNSLISQLSTQANTVSATGNARSDVTTNYEVDRTISHVKGPLGELKRLSVAVVVNYRKSDNEFVALENNELESINQLVMQAVGYSSQRGDTISVVNSKFNDAPDFSVPFWKNGDYIELAINLMKYLLIALLFFVFWRVVVNPIIQGMIQASNEAEARRDANARDQQKRQQAQQQANDINRYEDNLKTARAMAEKDPRAVAMVLRGWINKANDDKR